MASSNLESDHAFFLTRRLAQLSQDRYGFISVFGSEGELDGLNQHGVILSRDPKLPIPGCRPVPGQATGAGGAAGARSNNREDNPMQPSEHTHQHTHADGSEHAHAHGHADPDHHHEHDLHEHEHMHADGTKHSHSHGHAGSEEAHDHTH
ncbi:MAG: hypothetical protein WA428_00975 [Candidatus Cybelea sp.]